MTTNDERIAKALEALTRIAQDIKAEWRAEREAQARGSNRGLLDTNTMRPLKTVSGRLVGYAFPDETITVHETAPGTTNLVPVPNKRYIVIDETFDTPVMGFQRFNGTLYDLSGDTAVEVCGDLVPQVLNIARAELNNRPKVIEFLKNFSNAEAPIQLEIINMHVRGGDVVFYGVMGADTPNRRQIEAVIKDVY